MARYIVLKQRPDFRSYAVTPHTGEEEEEKKEEAEKEEEEILSVVKTRPVNVPVKEELLTELGPGGLSLFEKYLD